MAKKCTLSGVEKLPRGVRIHRSGGYIADVCVNKQRYTRVCRSLAEAVEARKLLVQEHKAAISAASSAAPVRPSTNDAWTLAFAIKKTFQLVWEGKGSEQTNMFNSDAAIKFFGADMPVKKITLDRIDEYVEHMLSIGNSGGTINRKLSCLSRALRIAHERGKLTTLPKMPRRREGTHRIRFLAPEEEARLIAYVNHLGYYDHEDAITLLIYTGFRCSELWRLERRDIDLEHNTITAWQTKNGHPRTIPIVETIRPIIERRMQDAPTDTSRLFPDGSNPWLRQVWDKLRMHLGMDDDPQFVPHMLRHTCATRLSQKGASMAIIKEWMGHSDIKTTARYTHFAPKDLLNAAAMLATG